MFIMEDTKCCFNCWSSKVVVCKWFKRNWVQCDACGDRTRNYKSEKKAIEVWNRRRK